jgi:GH25 family lysozyme M1 (1,4-beta-N-acetylmuramidase)
MKHTYHFLLLCINFSFLSCNRTLENKEISSYNLLEIGDKLDKSDALPFNSTLKNPKIEIESDKDTVHFGLDISHYQGDIVKDLNTKDSLKFIICKATQGSHYVDPDFRNNWSLIESKGYIRGAYHFYTCNQTPEIQAQHFSTVVGSFNQNDIAPILDIEQGSLIPNINVEQLQQDILTFLKEMERLTGRKPILYTDYAFAQQYLKKEIFSTYSLWLAEYSNRSYPLIPNTWMSKGFKIWQRKDNYNIHSINSDLDVFYGELKSLIN